MDNDTTNPPCYIPQFPESVQAAPGMPWISLSPTTPNYAPSVVLSPPNLVPMPPQFVPLKPVAPTTAQRNADAVVATTIFQLRENKSLVFERGGQTIEMGRNGAITVNGQQMVCHEGITDAMFKWAESFTAP